MYRFVGLIECEFHSLNFIIAHNTNIHTLPVKPGNKHFFLTT